MLIFAAYEYMFKCNDALESVINTLIEGHSLTILMVILFDCAVALDALVGTTFDHPPFGHLLIEIISLLEAHKFILQNVDRHQNRVPHSVAIFGRTGGSTTC